MRKILVLTFIFYCSTLFGRQADFKQNRSIEASCVSHKKTEDAIEFRVDRYHIDTVFIEGKKYSRVYLPGASIWLKKGHPELPKYAKSIIIPDNGVMDFQIIEMECETVRVAPIIPSKGNLPRMVNPDEIPYEESDFYSQDKWFPTKIIELSAPYILRDFRGITVRFNPFLFNPMKGKLIITKRIRIRIYLKEAGGINTFSRSRKTIDRAWREVYEAHFLNFSEVLSKDYPFLSEEPGRMLIITADKYYDNLQEFVKWKKRKGIDVKVVKVSTIGNSETSIKNYIQNEYDNYGVTWILLVGNESDVVPATGKHGDAIGNNADPVYAYLAGNDYYPDAFVSRISGDNETHINTQINKILNYERNPPSGSWFHKATGIATMEGEPADSTRANWLRDTLLAYTYIQVDKIYEPYWTTQAIIDSVNKGRSIVNFIGHGSRTAWGSDATIFDINNALSLSNSEKLPFVFSVACLVGDFDWSSTQSCLMEAWMWNSNGGAIASYGASILQDWVPPCHAQNHAMGLLKREEATTIGGLCFNGAMYMIDVDGTVDMFETWHIFGDASVDIWTDIPRLFTVIYPDTVFDYSEVTVTVKDGYTDDPVQDALVCFWKGDEIYETEYTDADGIATYNMPWYATSGYMYITVSKHNYIPCAGSTYVREAIHVPFEYPTIQEAIDAAEPGRIVYVHAGYYFERIRMKDGVDVIGESKDNTYIMGNPGDYNYRATALFDGCSATISNFTIGSISDSIGVLVLNCSNPPSIHNNRIMYPKVGIAIVGVAHPSCAYVYDNEITVWGAPWGYGIYCDCASTKTWIYNNSLRRLIGIRCQNYSDPNIRPVADASPYRGNLLDCGQGNIYCTYHSEPNIGSYPDPDDNPNAGTNSFHGFPAI